MQHGHLPIVLVY